MSTYFFRECARSRGFVSDLTLKWILQEVLIITYKRKTLNTLSIFLLSQV